MLLFIGIISYLAFCLQRFFSGDLATLPDKYPIFLQLSCVVFFFQILIIFFIILPRMAEFLLTSLCHNVGSGLMAEPRKRIFLQQLYGDSFIITENINVRNKLSAITVMIDNRVLQMGYYLSPHGLLAPTKALMYDTLGNYVENITYFIWGFKSHPDGQLCHGPIFCASGHTKLPSIRTVCGPKATGLLMTTIFLYV
jgi:hypothetical protein